MQNENMPIQWGFGVHAMLGCDGMFRHVLRQKNANGPFGHVRGDTFRVVHGAKMLGGMLAIAAAGLWQDWQ